MIKGANKRGTPSSEEESHIVIKDGELICLNCQDTYRPNLPCPVSIFVAICNEFDTLHEECVPRKGNEELRVRPKEDRNK